MALNKEQFDHFVAYTRKMLSDISDAKIGHYHNNKNMKEIAVSWNPNSEGPAIKGYPIPENVTHIVSEPYQTIGMGEYAFKKVINSLLKQSGFKAHNEVFISKLPKNSVECTMYSGGELDFDLDPDFGSSNISMFFIRANGDLDPALKLFKDIGDGSLRSECAQALKDINRPYNPPKRANMGNLSP